MKTSHSYALTASECSVSDSDKTMEDIAIDSVLIASVSPPVAPIKRQQPTRHPILSLVTRSRLDILIFVGVVIIATVAWMRPELMNLGGWGYLGAFLINSISTATILLPAPGIAAIFAIADEYNPILLGIVTGFGGAVGSLTAYWLGTKGQRIIKGGRVHNFLTTIMERFGGLVLFLSTFIFFMPADITSIVAGTTKYPIRRYFFYVSAGHILKMILILWAFDRYFDSIMMMF